MVRFALVLSAAATALVTLAAPASADTRHCVTPHVGPFPTVEECIWLPDPGVQ